MVCKNVNCCRAPQSPCADFGARYGADRCRASQSIAPINQVETSDPENEAACNVLKMSGNYPPHGSQDLPCIFPPPTIIAIGNHSEQTNDIFPGLPYLPAIPFSTLPFQPSILSPRPSTPPPWLYPQRQSPSSADLMAMILSSLLCPAVPATAASPPPPPVLLPRASNTSRRPP